MEGLNIFPGSDQNTVPTRYSSPTMSSVNMERDDEPTQMEETEMMLTTDVKEESSSMTNEEETEECPIQKPLETISSSFVQQSQRNEYPTFIPSQKDLIDCPCDLYLSSSIIYRYKTATLNLRLPTGWREKNGIPFSAVLNACLYPRVFSVEDPEHELVCPKCGAIIEVRDEKEVPIMKVVEGREMFSVMVRTLCTSSKEHLPGKRLVIGIDIPGCKRIYSHQFNIQSRYRPNKSKGSIIVSREKLTVFQSSPKEEKKTKPRKGRPKKEKPVKKEHDTEMLSSSDTSGLMRNTHPKINDSTSSTEDDDSSYSFIEAEGKVNCPIAEKAHEIEPQPTTIETKKDEVDEFEDPLGNLRTTILGKVQSQNPRQRTIAFGAVGPDGVPVLPFSSVAPFTSYVVGTNPAVIQYIDSKLTDQEMESLLNDFQSFMVLNGFCKEDGIMFFKTNQSKKYIIIAYSDKSFIGHLESYLRNKESETQNSFQKDLLEAHIITLIGDFVLGTDIEPIFTDEPFSMDIPTLSSKFMD